MKNHVCALDLIVRLCGMAVIAAGIGLGMIRQNSTLTATQPVQADWSGSAPSRVWHAFAWAS
jgi:hypothetical protein